jgi:putative spermidine/putrescine transport system substrate-binding protein
MKHVKRLVASASLLCLCTPVLAQDLTVVSFGGAYGEAQRKHMIEPFEAETGKTLIFEDYSGGVAEMKAQVEAGTPLWDVVDVEMIDLERACSEGLWEVIDKSQLPAGEDGTAAQDDFYPDAIANECGVGVILWSIIYAFDPAKFGGQEPQSVADVFDTAKFPGPRALRKRPQVNLEWALIADGVAPADVYKVLATPEGQDRAFAKLDTIRDSIVWFDSWSQAPQLLNDGGAVIVQSANGRIYDSIVKDKAPFKIGWAANVYDLDVWAILRGSKNVDTAMDFIKFATSTTPLVGVQDVAYGPTRKSSAARVSPEVLPNLPSSHLKEGLKADSAFWANYGEALGERFNEWLLK